MGSVAESRYGEPMGIQRFLTRAAPRPDAVTMARDHLANERTFLSWVRTALGFVGFGLLVAELVDTEGVQAEVLGLCLILLGAVIAVSSTARFLRVAERLDKNEYQASTISPVVVGVSTVIVAIVGLIFAVT